MRTPIFQVIMNVTMNSLIGGASLLPAALFDLPHET